uniref:Uncharacterized protein n=1 Tax=Rhizophora mucronata TaxID=61149 RepID=A0A2P2NDL3_RHIMU
MIYCQLLECLGNGLSEVMYYFGHQDDKMQCQVF